MKEFRVLVSLLSAFVAALLCPSAFANNGIQYYEFTETFERYIACLGEYVEIEYTVHASYHEFETPSGTYHLIDNWKITSLYTGISTGRTWYGKGVSPFQWNIMGPGETNQYTETIVAKPLTGDGPKIKIHDLVKVTVNANGDVVVDFWNNSDLGDGEAWKCIGKK